MPREHHDRRDAQPGPSAPVGRLRGFLEQLDVPSSTLRRDRWGATWLPPELRALVDADAECREELRRFVDRELELFGSVRERADAMFTARVIGATAPVEIAGAGLDPRRRSAILGLAYALATVVAYVMLAPLLEAGRGGAAGRIAATPGLESGVATGSLLVVLAAILAVVPWRTRTRP